MIDLEGLILKDIGDTKPIGVEAADEEIYDNICKLEVYLTYIQDIRDDLMNKLSDNEMLLDDKRASVSRIARLSRRIYNNHCIKEEEIKGE